MMHGYGIIRFAVEPWRGGRVVDCTGLENRSLRKGTQGSNPCLSVSEASVFTTFAVFRFR